MMDMDALEKRLARVEARIADTEARLPAHSVKPPVMIDLFALEDERDEILKAIEAARGEANVPRG